MTIFNSYVKLPDGTCHWILIIPELVINQGRLQPVLMLYRYHPTMDIPVGNHPLVSTNIHEYNNLKLWHVTDNHLEHQKTSK